MVQPVYAPDPLTKVPNHAALIMAEPPEHFFILEQGLIMKICRFRTWLALGIGTPEIRQYAGSGIESVVGLFGLKQTGGGGLEFGFREWRWPVRRREVIQFGDQGGVLLSPRAPKRRLGEHFFIQLPNGMEPDAHPKVLLQLDKCLQQG